LRQVFYTEEHWRLLNSLRERAVQIMDHLGKHGFRSIVYGSVARGDVKPSSDVEIFIPDVVSPSLLEHTISQLYPIYKRVLVQATPSYAAKAYIYLNEKDTISFPMVRLNREEEGFYVLAGNLTLEELRKGLRKPGINKALNLVIPTENGHLEKPLRTSFEEAVSILGVSPDILSGRINVLLKRKEKGRTGVFQSLELSGETSFEEAFQRLLTKSPALRRRMI